MLRSGHLWFDEWYENETAESKAKLVSAMMDIDDDNDDDNNKTIMESENVARHHNKTFNTVEYAEYSFDTSVKRPSPHSSPEPETKRQAFEVDGLSNYFSAAQDDAKFKAMNSNVNKMITPHAIEIVEQITSNNNNPSELERIQRECVSMVETLKALHEEEKQLREANSFLAHCAVVMGCTAGLDGGTRRGARRKAAAKKAASTAP